MVATEHGETAPRKRPRFESSMKDDGVQRTLRGVECVFAGGERRRTRKRHINETIGRGRTDCMTSQRRSFPEKSGKPTT